jgi:sulfur carrier protein
MRLQVNGKEEVVQNDITVGELLKSKGINPNLVACELNLSIIRRANLPTVILKEGDVLEIIQMMGGG